MDNDRLNQFRQKAVEAGYKPRDVNLFLLSKLLQMGQSQNQNNTSLIPNATGADISLIPNAGGNQFSLLGAKGPVTQAFGNYNPGLYRGINKSMRNTGVDIGVPEGTDVNLPPGLWEIEEATKGNWNRGYGNSLLVKNAQTGEKLRFSHLSKVANLKKGQKVPGGVRIAQTGATGNVTGPHLDLEYYDKANRLNNVLSSPYRRFL